MHDTMLSIVLASKLGTYGFIIAASVIIILSYLFNILAKKTNVPSVLMLIVLGILLKQGMTFFNVSAGNLSSALEILGTVGLIMIVLEAALELELTKEKWPIIWKSFVVAMFALVGSAFVCAFIIHFFIVDSFFNALVYAIPLSIMSSAIIIPSVGGLDDTKKEFMIYESTFSDILGIMFFYFLVGNADAQSAKTVVLDVVTNIFITIGLAVVISYGLVFLFQKLKTQVKLFLLIAVLLLAYSIGKMFHLSSLIIILIFGLVLSNHLVFFRGPLKKLINGEAIGHIMHDFHVVTVESAFVIRTFFFVIFGINIVLGSLADPAVAVISCLIVAGLYLVRFIFLKLFVRRDIFPQLYIAPRGLITILLFYQIPRRYMDRDFDSGILLYTILITSIIMTISLIKNGLRIESMKEVVKDLDLEPAEPLLLEEAHPDALVMTEPIPADPAATEIPAEESTHEAEEPSTPQEDEKEEESPL